MRSGLIFHVTFHVDAEAFGYGGEDVQHPADPCAAKSTLESHLLRHPYICSPFSITLLDAGKDALDLPSEPAKTIERLPEGRTPNLEV
jgi:hypothetical protein